MRKHTYIYGLKDPRDGKIYYVGKSNHPALRLESHLKDKYSNHRKAKWIDELQVHGMRPELELLEKVSRSEWGEKEKQWIALGLSEGWPLTNITIGGEDIQGYVPSYWRDIMRCYLPEDLLDKFIGLSHEEKVDVAKNIALEMFKYSGLAIRQKGGDVRTDYDEQAQYLAGVKKACQIVCAI